MDNTPLSFPMSKLGGRYCPRENDHTDQTPASPPAAGRHRHRRWHELGLAACRLPSSPGENRTTRWTLRVRGGGCGASKASLPVRTPHRMHSQSVTHILLAFIHRLHYFPGRGGGVLFLLRALHIDHTQ